MTNPTMPSASELEKAILFVFNQAAGSLTNEQISENVINHLKITPEVSTIMHSESRTELDYRLAWARTRLSKKNSIIRVGPKTWKALP